METLGTVPCFVIGVPVKTTEVQRVTIEVQWMTAEWSSGWPPRGPAEDHREVQRTTENHFLKSDIFTTIGDEKKFKKANTFQDQSDNRKGSSLVTKKYSSPTSNGLVVNAPNDRVKSFDWYSFPCRSNLPVPYLEPLWTTTIKKKKWNITVSSEINYWHAKC